MKPDLYTKTMLTVIATSLLWLAVQNFSLRTVSAQSGLQRVALVSLTGAPLQLNSGGLPVTVWLQSVSPNMSPLNVNVSEQ
jgi:hypothetical protein